MKGEAAIPGDKSISQRALILGALAEGRTVISGLLESGDVHSTAGALRGFGAELTRQAPGVWQVRGTGVGKWKSPQAPAASTYGQATLATTATLLRSHSTALKRRAPAG